MVEPAYSMAWPAAPSAPMRGDDGQSDVLGGDARGRSPSTRTRRRWGGSATGYGSSAHGPLPRRRCRRPAREGAVGGGVAVAADDGQSGRVNPAPAPPQWTMPCPGSSRSNSRTRMAQGVGAELLHHAADGGIDALQNPHTGGHIMVLHAEGEIGRATSAARALSLSKAWNEPSCRKWRSIHSRLWPSSRRTTSWASHTLSNKVAPLRHRPCCGFPSLMLRAAD